MVDTRRPVEIETARLRLREFTLADLHDLSAIRADPDVMRYVKAAHHDFAETVYYSISPEEYQASVKLASGSLPGRMTSAIPRHFRIEVEVVHEVLDESALIQKIHQHFVDQMDGFSDAVLQVSALDPQDDRNTSASINALDFEPARIDSTVFRERSRAPAADEAPYVTIDLRPARSGRQQVAECQRAAPLSVALLVICNHADSIWTDSCI